MLQLLLAWFLFRPRKAVSSVEIKASGVGEDLLEATLEVAQTQILAQLADETSIDGRTMGVLGFLGALLATDIAAKNILGSWWWTPLVGVGVAIIPCLLSVFDGDTRMGPPGLTFYATFGGYPSVPAREQLLADLHEAYETNAVRVARKKRRLRSALGFITAGLVAASLMITLDRPNRMDSHDETSAPASTYSGARTVSTPAGNAQRDRRSTPVTPSSGRQAS